MNRHNLHTHTTFSDGLLRPFVLIAKALNENIEVIGISDHAFAGKLLDDSQITNNMEDYLNTLNNIKNIWNEKIKVKIGAEIEADQFGTVLSKLPFDVLNKFDYLLFEYIGLPQGRDISELVEIRQKITIPIGLAHNDIQFNYDKKEQEIAKILSYNDIFVELCQSEELRNSRYSDKFNQKLDFYKFFSPKLIEEFVKNDVKVVIGTDTHKGTAVSKIDEVYDFIKKNNLKPHELVYLN